MRWLALLLLWPVLALAQVPLPPCWPIIDGDKVHPRHWPVVYRDGIGAGLAYWCRVGDKWVSVTRWGAYSQIGNDYHAKANAEAAAVFSAADPRAAAEAAHKRLVTGQVYTSCDQVPSATRPLCTGLVAELRKYPPPPIAAEVWTVAASGLAVDRPTRFWPYQYTAGGAIRIAPERAPIGAACNPAVGEGSWRGVLGRTDRVALCVKQ